MKRLALFAVLAAALFGPAVRAEQALDPYSTTLPMYRLHDAKVDGKLDEWAGMRGAVDSKFKPMSADVTITPSADFWPRLRCGRMEGSNDLYFLIVILDDNLWAASEVSWPQGDVLELYLDYGRAQRDAENKEWYKKNVHAPKGMIQFGLQPRTLKTQPKVFYGTNAAGCEIDYASIPVHGGIAYEVRVDGKTALEKAELEEMPPYIGFNLGPADLDYPIFLSSGSWSNFDGWYRLFGSGMDHAYPNKYGMLSTKPILPATDKYVQPPASLAAMFGEFPTGEDIANAIGEADASKLADLVYWAGLQGAIITEDLVQKLNAVDSAAVQKNLINVLQFTDQDEAAVKAAVANVYATRAKALPQALVSANMINEKLGIGYSAELRDLMTHDDLTVAFTAARALAQTGDADDAEYMQETMETLLAKYEEQQTAGDKSAADKKRAVNVFIGGALDVLLGRTQPVPEPDVVLVRQILPENSDAPRHMPFDNNNVYSAANLLRSWGDGQPKELWRAEIGKGLTSVIEADGRTFATGKDGEAMAGYCFDAVTGEIIWKKTLREKSGDSTNTPVADGDRVYFITPGIVCLNAADGTEIWSEEKAYKCVPYTSPLIIGNVMYIGAAHPGGLVAADKMTGEMLWSTAKGFSSSPNCPGYQVIEGLQQIVISVGKGNSVPEVWGVNALTGEPFWKRPFNGRYGCCSSPVIAGSKVYITAGHSPNFSECLQMFVEEGRIKARLLYHDEDTQSNSHNTPAIVGEAVFGFSKSGLQCTDLENNEVLWRTRWSGDRHLIVADGLIFTVTPEGDLVMAEANTESYKELGRIKTGLNLGGNTQQMTIANGRIYIRGAKQVVCYDLVNAE